MADQPQVEVKSASALRRWLKANYTQKESVWLVTYKKHCGKKHLSWPDLVDELLCYGWIDGQRQKVDADRTMIRISPRRAKSNWSRINKEKIERLTAEGRMTPAGLAKVEAARKDGSWTALDDVEAEIVPDELEQALQEAGVKKAFDELSSSNRKGFLWWVKSAKREATRKERVANSVECMRRGIKMPKKVL